MPEIELEIGFHLDSIDDQSQDALSRRMKHAAGWVAERFGSPFLQISISVVDDATIQRLNRLHLQHDWPTDVISFAFETGSQVSGEIIASWDTASRLSPLAGWSAQDELLLYVVHGMLHLVGLDDQSPSDRQLMRATEHEFLLAAGFPGAKEYLERFDDVSY